MNNSRKIRIENLNHDWEKLKKDYEDVADKKRRESNPQEQNDLQLQLDTIAKKMEEIEQHLQEIKQQEEEKNFQVILKKLGNLSEEQNTAINIHNKYSKVISSLFS